jgi:hypothetical protein
MRLALPRPNALASASWWPSNKTTDRSNGGCSSGWESSNRPGCSGPLSLAAATAAAAAAAGGVSWAAASLGAAVPPWGNSEGCCSTVPGRYRGRGGAVANCDRLPPTCAPARAAAAEAPASAREPELRRVPPCAAFRKCPQPALASPSIRPLGGCGGRPPKLPSLPPPLLPMPVRPLPCAQAPCRGPAAAAVSGRCWVCRPAPAGELAPRHASASESAKGSSSREAAWARAPPDAAAAAALLPRRRPSSGAERARLPVTSGASVAASATAGCGATARQGTHSGSAAEGGGAGAAVVLSSSCWSPADAADASPPSEAVAAGASHGIGAARTCRRTLPLPVPLALPLPLSACSAACKSPQHMRSRCSRRTSAARGVTDARAATGGGRAAAAGCACRFDPQGAAGSGTSDAAPASAGASPEALDAAAGAVLSTHLPPATATGGAAADSCPTVGAGDLRGASSGAGSSSPTCRYTTFRADR